MKFTSSQRAAIEITDRNLAVSAGAGSGKTATLVERVYHLITGANPPCRIDQLLVVTFTRAAAAEMKERLVHRLRLALAEEGMYPDQRAHLEEQLYLLPGASLSTIHSFCLDLVSSFPNLIGLAPGFELMAEEEARLFRREFLLEKITGELQTNTDTGRVLRRLLDVRDPLSGVDGLVSQLASLHEFLDSLTGHDALVRATRDLADPDSQATASLVETFLAESLERLAADLLPLVEFDSSKLNSRFGEQHLAVKTLYDCLSTPVSIHGLPLLVEQLSLPALSRARIEDSEEDIRFKGMREKAMVALRVARKELEQFFPERLRQRLALSSGISQVFLRDCGVAWNKEHFKRHLAMRKLTFSHLEKLSYRLLQEIPDAPRIRAWYRERFQHVLVDEFQDVNELQNAIIRSVSRDGGDGEGGNRFFVGDVKQSIYQFRQADPALFLEMLDKSFSHGEADLLPLDTRIDLVENFRSAPALLEEFNRLFRGIIRRGTAGVDYTDGHEFVAGRKDPRPPRPAAFVIDVIDKQTSDEWEEEGDAVAEAALVAKRIAAMGPPWRDHVILLRSTRGSAPALIDALETQGVPTYCDARIGFLTAVEVIEFRTLLRAIANPFHDVALLGMLRGPAFRWSDEDLLHLRLVARDDLYIQNLEAVAGMQDHPLSAFAKVAIACLEKWQDWANRHTMAEFFAKLMDDIGLLESASTRPGGDQRRLNLEYLLERGRQFDRFARKGLDEFLRFLDDLIDNGEDFAPPSPLSEDADVVRIMTVHASKGMQFPVVHLPFLAKRFNEEDLRRPFLYDRQLGLACSVPDVMNEDDEAPLTHALLRNHLRSKLIAEELRLLYVALTRAREAAYLSASIREPESINRGSGRGDIPVSVIQGAAKAFDWIAAHAALRFPGANFARSGEVARDGIASIHVHRGDQLASLQQDLVGSRVHGERPEKLPSGLAAEFARAAARIDTLEAATAPTPLRAKVSVTELKRLYDAWRDVETPPYEAPHVDEPSQDAVELPARFQGDAPPSGAQRGQAVHRFLANCDLVALARGESRLTAERDRLVAEGILAPEEAVLVSLKGIQWFLNSDLGKQVLRGAARAERERPFIVRIDTGDIDPSRPGGVMLLQGVADLLFPTPEGWVLIDFKTDFCGEAGERVATLARGYTTQLQLYRLAIGKTLREPVAAAWLVFLHGRECVEIAAPEDGADGWRGIFEAAWQGE